MSDVGYVIVDIDGTVADVEHRRHHLPDWGKFFQDLDKDPPIKPVIEIVRTLEGRHKIVFVSGRPDTYRDQTLAWLEQHMGLFGKIELHMRKGGDNRPDTVVKLEILQMLRQTLGGDPIVTIDDRQSVVGMWRAQGIVCLQAAPGDFDKPKTVPLLRQPTLTVMVGPSGAGKSTWLSKNRTLDEVFSSDKLREQLLGDMERQDKNAQIFQVLHKLVQTRLECGLDATVDATNLRRKDRLAVVALAETSKATVIYVVIDRPLEEKLKTRGWRSEELVKRHDQLFKSQLRDILSGDDGKAEVHDFRTV